MDQNEELPPDNPVPTGGAPGDFVYRIQIRDGKVEALRVRSRGGDQDEIDRKVAILADLAGSQKMVEDRRYADSSQERKMLKRAIKNAGGDKKFALAAAELAALIYSGQTLLNLISAQTPGPAQALQRPTPTGDIELASPPHGATYVEWWIQERDRLRGLIRSFERVWGDTGRWLDRLTLNRSIRDEGLGVVPKPPSSVLPTDTEGGPGTDMQVSGTPERPFVDGSPKELSPTKDQWINIARWIINHDQRLLHSGMKYATHRGEWIQKRMALLLDLAPAQLEANDPSLHNPERALDKSGVNDRLDSDDRAVLEWLKDSGRTLERLKPFDSDTVADQMRNPRVQDISNYPYWKNPRPLRSRE